MLRSFYGYTAQTGIWFLSIPYFTTKPVGQGTGLGLTAVSRFASSSQGRVRVGSEKGSGATFTLAFPARSQSAEGATG